jgi:hypothetical protein
MSCRPFHQQLSRRSHFFSFRAGLNTLRIPVQRYPEVMIDGLYSASIRELDFSYTSNVHMIAFCTARGALACTTMELVLKNGMVGRWDDVSGRRSPGMAVAGCMHVYIDYTTLTSYTARI